jgi:magnesium transporter
MARTRVRRSKKAGLPPGSLVYTGTPRPGKPGIYVVSYDDQHFISSEAATVEEAVSYRGKARFLWINVDGIHDAETIGKFGDAFGIHALTQEDILNPDQRPRVEQFENILYIVLKALSLNGGGNRVEGEQISLVLGSDFLISFQEKVGDAFSPILERFKRDGSRLRSLGPDYLAYSLIDLIVDRYFTVLENVGEEIERLLGEVVEDPEPQRLAHLNQLKRDGLYLRRCIWPLREVLAGLERGDSRLINSATQPFLRDVYSHVIEVIDTVETFREMLSNLLDIYLSSASNRLNAVMKVLTIITTIFMPLSFLTGVYGMNFDHMPALHSIYGFPVLVLTMAVIVACMAGFFKYKRWL